MDCVVRELYGDFLGRLAGEALVVGLFIGAD